MNLPRNEQRKENLILDLSQKEIFLQRREENLLMELCNIDQKIQRLNETKEVFNRRLKDLKVQQSQVKTAISQLKEVKFEQPYTETREERLTRLYREHPHLGELNEEELPSSVKSRYNL